MSDPARDVLAHALKLPVEARAEVAAELMRSLEEEENDLSPAELEQRWDDEVARRARRALRGESAGRDVDDVIREIETKLQPR